MTTETQKHSSANRWHIETKIFARFLEGFVDTQFGPIYIGTWGVLAVLSFAASVFTILVGYGVQVGFNPLRFFREFWVLAVYPPSAEYGLVLAPLEKGGYWQIATFFLTTTVYCWLIRVWDRALAHKLRPMVAVAWSAAIFLFSAIYIIHPIMVGTWNDAPGHGLKAQLDWANYFSIKYGNFFYNPFHMVAIFFLLGSTVLLAMHGATILGVLHLNAHRELDEIETSSEGTQRAQLFWRWVMGFNATATSIHTWSMAFGVLTVVFGAIGVLMSGWFEPNWFLWACRAGIVPGAQMACPAVMP
jgi:photosynthetic reaction center M subunit